MDSQKQAGPYGNHEPKTKQSDVVTLQATQGLHVIKQKETPLETGKARELLEITFGDIPKAYII